MKKPPTSAAGAVPLRTRKKDATRRALVQAAQQRFREQGFDATTIDELCTDAGVSRRTFFRYFPDKEALAFPHRSERLRRFVALLEDAPARANPIDTLRAIAHVFAQEYSANHAQLVAQQRLIDRTPALVAREHEIDRDWERAMERAFARRLGNGADASLRARMMAGAAIGVIRATLRHWFELDGAADLGELGERALDALQAGFLDRPR